ncbi:hypothetical protein B0H13DRAFT_2343494 [Mycena leptocephala]|nr:hypothetical protein B0H13DRAFT_2343494 [Mycena leptocephala]
MSPKQVSLAQRLSDVVINDIAMLCNMYGMPLNMFVVINHFFKTRNIAYASETADEHEWALSRLFSVLPQHLDRVFFSHWDAGFCVAVGRCNSSEIAFHARCLHHLDSSVIRKLAGRLDALLQPFREAFWRVYYAFSPEALNWLGSNSYLTIPQQLRTSSPNYGHAVIDGHSLCSDPS